MKYMDMKLVQWICLMYGIGIIRIMGSKRICDGLALDLIYNGKRPKGHIQ